ncbi:MAG: helix-turn-helix domain-containing protein, partial [Lachnospirales bacterium]
MTIISQTIKYCLSLIKYAKKYGVTKAAIRYKTNRQYIYRWLKRYDGTNESLLNKSTKPHSHPNQHTEEEIKLIRNMRKRNKHYGLVVFW